MPKRQLSIESLWKRYLKTRDVALRNDIVVHYTPLVHTHAARLSRKLPAQISYDEICSAAFDGLIEAVEAYDPERKAKFETFCQQRISGAVMDWLRSLDPQSRTVRTFEKQLQAALERLHLEQEAPATEKEVAERMGMSLARFRQLARLSQLGREVHFSAMEPAEERRGQHSGRTWDVKDPHELDPARSVARAFLSDYLSKGLACEERLVLQLYYYENMTMADIGLVLDLSESRVSQIHKEIINRLRHRLGGSLQEELVA